MRKTWLSLLLVMLFAGIASAQSARRLDVGACASVDSTFGPLRCPTSSCGTYYTVQTEACTIDNECDLLLPISVCCGKFPNYVEGGTCLLAEIKDPRVKSRMLELAKDNQILVPTCNGAYVPARVAFRKPEWRDNGGQ
jgi:hypothetical protein